MSNLTICAKRYGVKPNTTNGSKELVERLDKDHWNQDLWDEFAWAVQDPMDYGAVKEINRLARNFIDKDGFSDDEKSLINGLFITLCGSGLDTLIERSAEEIEY